MSILLTTLATIYGSAEMGLAKHISNTAIRNIAANVMSTVSQKAIEKGVEKFTSKKQNK